MSGDTIHPQSSQSAQRWPFPYPGESEARFDLRTKRYHGDMPEAFHLHRIQWQVMGHFTFKSLRPPENIPRAMFKATMRKLCKRHRFYFPKLMWALRSELGTRKDLCPHFHFLLAALPGQIDLERFCQDCKAAWLALGGGISVVEPYTRQLDGAGYLAKHPHTGQDPVGNDCELTFSDASLDYLRRVVQRERGI